MKIMLDVKDAAEATAIKTAMQDDVTRAFVVIVGTLMQLPTDRARRRVLRFVTDQVEAEVEETL